MCPDFGAFVRATVASEQNRASTLSRHHDVDDISADTPIDLDANLRRRVREDSARAPKSLRLKFFGADIHEPKESMPVALPRLKDSLPRVLCQLPAISTFHL